MILTHVLMCKSNSLYSVLRMDIDHSWKRSSAGARIHCPAQLDLLITHSKLQICRVEKNYPLMSHFHTECTIDTSHKRSL